MPRYFNPRLHEGGDSLDGFIEICTFISIHASVKEATLSIDPGTAEVDEFQSTPP